MKPFFTEDDFPGFEKPMSLEHRFDCAFRANEKIAPLIAKIEQVCKENERLKKQLEATIEVAQMRGVAACDGVARIKELEKELQSFADAWNELEVLQGRIAQLESEKEFWGNEFVAVHMAKDRIKEQNARIASQEATIATLEAALKFYAEAEHYHDKYPTQSCGCCSIQVDSLVFVDEGEKARAALAGGEKGEEYGEVSPFGAKAPSPQEGEKE